MSKLPPKRYFEEILPKYVAGADREMLVDLILALEKVRQESGTGREPWHSITKTTSETILRTKMNVLKVTIHDFKYVTQPSPAYSTYDGRSAISNLP